MKKKEEKINDEINDFRERIKTLQNVAIEINTVLEKQNIKLEENDGLLEKSVKKIKFAVQKISLISKRKFNPNLYMVLATFLFIGILYIFFIS